MLFSSERFGSVMHAALGRITETQLSLLCKVASNKPPSDIETNCHTHIYTYK